MLKGVWRLIRRAWLPLSIACLLIIGLELGLNAVQHALDGRMAAQVHALKPDGPNPRQLLIYDLEIPEGYTREEYADAWLAHEAAVNTYNTHANLLDLSLNLPALALTPVMLLGLYRALLRIQRGDAARPGLVFSGCKRGGGRAIWLDVLILLRVAGFVCAWMAAMLLLRLLSLGLWKLMEIMGVISFLVLILYLEYRYAFAPLHLADDDVHAAASDCIRYGVEDLQSMPVLGILITLWPMTAALAADILLTALLPEGPLSAALSAGLTAFVFLVRHAGLAVIYQHLRDEHAARKLPSENPGLQRARALASGETEVHP